MGLMDKISGRAGVETDGWLIGFGPGYGVAVL